MTKSGQLKCTVFRVLYISNWRGFSVSRGCCGNMSDVDEDTADDSPHFVRKRTPYNKGACRQCGVAKTKVCLRRVLGDATVTDNLAVHPDPWAEKMREVGR